MACEEYRDRMLDVLYGEAGEADRVEWDAHVRGCGPCRAEMDSLRALRRDLGAWTVRPAPGLPSAAPPRRWLAVAAALVAASAATALVAGTDVRVADGGVTVRVGRPADDAVARALAAQDERHRAAIAALEARLAAPVSPAGFVALEDVHRLIRESESRQAVLFDAGLRDLADRADAQRRQDMAQISAGLSYVEGRTGMQVARTTELMGHVLQAAQKK